MTGHAYTVGYIFVTGPINRKIFIKLLFLKVIVYGIGIQTAMAYISGSQLVKHKLGICIKTLGIFIIPWGIGGWP